MKNCANCVYSSIECGAVWLCNVAATVIEHPHIQGGPKKCECYKPMDKVPKIKFKYPTKDDLKKFEEEE